MTRRRALTVGVTATGTALLAAGIGPAVRRTAGGLDRMSSSSADARVESVPVSFQVDGVEVVGELFLPAGQEAGTALPGVVCAGTWTSVRQQMTDRYARKLAAEGLAALSFDFRSYGASGGEPRQVESAAMKAEDITAAAEFLRAREEVGGRPVGGLAICASAMYMAGAIAAGAPLDAFATVAAWLHDPGTVGLVYGGEAGVRRRLAAARAARERYEATGEVAYVPAESPDDPDAAMVGVAFYEDPARGLIPEWDNRFAVMQWEEWLTLDGVSPAAEIAIPTMVVHSDGSALPDNARRFHGLLAGPKGLTWLEGEHTQFYDTEPYVTQAARVAAAHLKTALGA